MLLSILMFLWCWLIVRMVIKLMIPPWWLKRGLSFKWQFFMGVWIPKAFLIEWEKKHQFAGAKLKGIAHILWSWLQESNRHFGWGMIAISWRWKIVYTTNFFLTTSLNYTTDSNSCSKRRRLWWPTLKSSLNQPPGQVLIRLITSWQLDLAGLKVEIQDKLVNERLWTVEEVCYVALQIEDKLNRTTIYNRTLSSDRSEVSLATPKLLIRYLKANSRMRVWNAILVGRVNILQGCFLCNRH